MLEKHINSNQNQLLESYIIIRIIALNQKIKITSFGELKILKTNSVVIITAKTIEEMSQPVFKEGLRILCWTTGRIEVKKVESLWFKGTFVIPVLNSPQIHTFNLLLITHCQQRTDLNVHHKNRGCHLALGRILSTICVTLWCQTPVAPPPGQLR